MGKKLVLLCLSIFVFGSIYSQAKKKQKVFSVKIYGSVKNYPGNNIYLHHKWGENDYTDSAVTKDGKFVMQVKSAEPNMYWFTSSRELNAQPNAIFFIEDKNVKAFIKGDSLSASIIDAGETQKDYKNYLKIGAALTVQQQKLQTDFTLATQKGDRMAVAAIQQQYQDLGVQFVSDLKTFVKTHPKSAVSGYVIFKELCSPNIPIENAVEALGLLDKSMEGSKFMNLASKKVNDIMGTQIGAIATDFSQSNPEGQEIKLSDLRGKYVLVDFWASWCRPCRLENPNVVAAYNMFKDKGFTVLGVSLDTNKDQWISAIQTDRLSWANVSDLKGGNNDVATLYGIQNIPQNVLIDRDGKIVAKNLRGRALEEKLQELFK